MQTISVKTEKHSQAVDITAEVRAIIQESGIDQGWCEVFVPHTTSAVAVNEAADPSVMVDMLAGLDRLVPWQGDYQHLEGNSAAHIKSVLVGSSVRIPIERGGMRLGTWQGIFFLEFDGPRQRKAWVDVRETF